MNKLSENILGKILQIDPRDGLIDIISRHHKIDALLTRDLWITVHRQIEVNLSRQIRKYTFS